MTPLSEEIEEDLPLTKGGVFHLEFYDEFYCTVTTDDWVIHKTLVQDEEMNHK